MLFKYVVIYEFLTSTSGGVWGSNQLSFTGCNQKSVAEQLQHYLEMTAPRLIRYNIMRIEPADMREQERLALWTEIQYIEAEQNAVQV